jgi:hypothetical protein
MNIFVFDADPVVAARQHPNKYLVKMPLETSQILCTAHHVLKTDSNTIPYKSTHVNHPCSIWVRQSKENYLWAVSYGLELCKTYTAAYSKTHACEAVLDWALETLPNGFTVAGLTPFVQAMPDEYKNKDAVVAYRQYFCGEKRHLADWSKLPWLKPSWYE